MRILIKIACIFIIIGSFHYLNGQSNSKIKTLRNASIQSLSPSIELIKAENYSDAKQVLDSIYSFAIAEKDSFLLSSTLENMGFLAYRLGRFNESIVHYEGSFNLDQALGDTINAAANLKSIGICYRQQGFYESALSYYHQALTLVYLLKLEREEASILNSIGNLYNELEQFNKSLSNFKRAQLIWSSLNDSTKNSFVLSNMGNALLGLNRVDEAINVYNRSLDLKRLVGTKSSIAITLNNLGEAYFKENDLPLAREYFLQSLKMREDSGQENRVTIVSHNLAKLELKNLQFFQAQLWLDKAKRVIQTTESQDDKLENLRIQKELYQNTGRLNQALETDRVYDSLKQIIFDEQVVNVQKLQYDFDLERKDQERERIQSRLDLIAIQYENRKFQSLIQTYVIIAAVLAVIIVSFFAYSLRKKNNHIENLIRELHHRVKNHLGMISGMFGAQTDLSVADTAVLDEAKTRVEAVNGIHRRLYRQDEYEYVNMHEYLEELVDNNALVFGLFNKIDKHLDISANIMEIDKAISVGLIANEVLTNAFKYGLQETQQPVLKIVLEKVLKGYRMIIFNNASADKSPGGGFGGELINRLAQNLKGQVQIAKEGGFQFELTFP